MYSSTIFLRTDQLNKNGTHSVYMRIIIARQKKDFSLNIYCKLKDWNFEKNIIKSSDPDYLRKNKYISKQLNKAINIIDSHFLNDKPLTSALFVSLFKQKLNTESFYEFMLYEIDNNNYSIATRKTYKTKVSKFQTFRKNLSFTDIDKNFIREYSNYCAKCLKNHTNTIYKDIKVFKSFLNIAVEKEIIKENLIKNISGKHIDTTKDSLTIYDIDKLESLYKSDKLSNKEFNVLRYFLFDCYTGLRFTDMKNLKFTDVKQQNIEGNEIKFIDIKMHKTGGSVSIPLLDKAINLMPKMYKKTDNIFKVYSNQKTNEYLKSIIKKSGINKNITFHSARHTLGTVAVNAGIPLEVVSKILGHKDLKTTLIYAKVNDTVKYNEMKKI